MRNMRACHRWAIFAMVGIVQPIMLVSAASAAPEHKRLCKQRIDSTDMAGSRKQAQRKAIDGWSAAAVAQHGESFGRWEIAGVARLSCSLTLEGHRCRAAASPCRDLADGAFSSRR